MTNAEEATNDFCTRCFKYNRCTKVQSECTMADSYQEGYEDGYHQAEKDLELTCDDIKIIVNAFLDFDTESIKNGKTKKHYTDEEYCIEILKRFNKERKIKL